MRCIASSLLCVWFASAVGCQGADTSWTIQQSATPSPPVDPDHNVVRCECELVIPDVYAPGCLWAGGSDSGGYCRLTRHADICYPPAFNPHSDTAIEVDAHVPSAADLDAFCDSRSPTLVSSVNLITGMCPPGAHCSQSFCEGTVAHCRAVRNGDGTVSGYTSRPACDQQCAPIPVTLDAAHHANNIGVTRESANYVQHGISCDGDDTPIICLASDN